MAQGSARANLKRSFARGDAMARRLRRPLLFMSLAMLASCAPLSEREPSLHDVTSGRNPPPEMLLDADAVLIGERHDNAEHHHIQAWIARQLVARGRRIAVVFEMIDQSQQPALKAFLAGKPANAAALGDLLAWSSSGWPDWSLYRPIADAALAQPDPPELPLQSGNLPLLQAREIARAGAAAGGLDTALSNALRQAPARDAGALAVHAKDIRDSHCGMLPSSAMTPFALAQYARDMMMARAIQAMRSRAPDTLVILIAGNGHVRNDVGVPLHLRRLMPAMKIVSVGLIEMPEGAPVAGAPYDYVWTTAPIERGDPCAMFRQPVR